MSKDVHGTRRRTGSLQSHTPCLDSADPPSSKPAPRDATGGRYLLHTILNTPRLEQVVPRLQPDLLHQVIQTCGLEDCGELVALATPVQLTNIFDLDLWRAHHPGLDEQFDADRFGLWLEVLLETGACEAAHKLAGMDVGLVVTGLAQHILVYDRAAVMPYETFDGEQVDTSRAVYDRLTYDVGGYVLVATRADSWEAIIEVLMSLAAEHPDYFQQVMRACRTLSNSGHEIDGLDDLLAERDQVMLDLAVNREGRREKKGYVTPAQARAFLQVARELRLESDARPPADPIAREYFRSLDESREADIDSASGGLAGELELAPDSDDTAEAVAAVFEVLLEAGVLAQSPRGLLISQEEHEGRLGRIHTHMQCVLERDQAAYFKRNEELAYLANMLMGGCAIQSRPFTAPEATDAAIAVCNLGLENWPPHWLAANANEPPSSFLIDNDLVSVFQVGWAVLHNNVSMYAAEQLIGILSRVRCDDREIQRGLDVLRIKMAKYSQAGTPWRARDALDVIVSLDMLTWAVLISLIDECPVLHLGVAALSNSRTLAVRVSDFEFISENSQIASIREFIQSLPETLR